MSTRLPEVALNYQKTSCRYELESTQSHESYYLSRTLAQPSNRNHSVHKCLPLHNIRPGCANAQMSEKNSNSHLQCQCTYVRKDSKLPTLASGCARPYWLWTIKYAMSVMTPNFFTSSFGLMLNGPVGCLCTEQRWAHVWSNHSLQKMHYPLKAPLHVLQRDLAPRLKWQQTACESSINYVQKLIPL